MENDNITNEIDPWEDEAFLQEMKSRIDDIESGNIEGISWEEVTRQAKAELNQRRNKAK